MKGNFDNIINRDQPTLIDFHALWCGPCKAQTPILKEVAKEIGKDARIIKIDIDKNQNIAQRYNIRSVPTIAIFKKGELVWQQAGVQTKGILLNALKKYV